MPQDRLDEDSSLPRATVDKLIQDLTPKPYVVSKDTRGIMREAAHAFLNFIALEASRMCDVEKKKTISTLHVFKSLEKYGFESFVGECDMAARNYDDYSRHKPSKQNKFKDSGKSMKELEEMQRSLFKEAAEKQDSLYGVQPEHQDRPEE
jgi:histone H3/H4